MGYDTCCNTSLTLGLVTDQDLPRNHTNLIDDHRQDQKKPTYSSLSLVNKFDHNQSFPSLMLGLSSSSAINDQPELNRQASSVSGVSSFSNSSVKRERDGVSAISGEEVEVEKVASKVIRSSVDDQEIEEGGARKKLRLSKEQSLVLEESFKEHSTLNPKQKQALAKRLNLRPRQVEVWFQNRRARTKLKQNELDCELLKKCCEALTDDNRRLQREIQELKAAKMAAPPAPTAVSSSLYMQFPAATLTMCPSCERISGNISDNSSKSPLFSLGTHRFGPFSSHPSAAC